MYRIKNSLLSSPVILIFGFLFTFIFAGFYYFHIYNPLIGALWIIAFILFSLYFFERREPASFFIKLNKFDFYNICGLYAAFIPVYLWFTYLIPFQVGADELHFFRAIYDTTINESSPDPFSISGYLGFAKFAFIILGNTAKYILGGVNFLNLRTAHALFGLTIIIPAYIFYRIYGTRFFAVGATALLMSQHALVNISRILSRNNFPVLNILAAFLLLFIGLPPFKKIQTKQNKSNNPKGAD